MIPLRHILLDVFTQQIPKYKLDKIFTQVPMEIPSWVLELYQTKEFKGYLDQLYELAEQKDNLFELAEKVEYTHETIKLLHSHLLHRHHQNEFISTEIHRIFIDNIVRNSGNLTVLLVDPTSTLVTDLRLSKAEHTTSNNLDFKDSIVIAKKEFEGKLGKRGFNNITYVNYPTVGLTEMYEHLRKLLAEEELEWLE